MPKSRFLTQMINIEKVGESDKKRIAKMLYESIFAKMWNGVSSDEFYHYFFDGKFARNILYLYQLNDRVIGYLIFRVIHVGIGNEAFSVPRISANVLPEFMGNKLTTRPVFKESVLCFVKTLLQGRRMMLFFTANSPASYAAFHNRTRFIYPSPNRPTPRIYENLVWKLGKSLSLDLDPANPFVCRFSGVSLSPSLSKSLDNTSGKVADFYRAQCPHYESGSALVTIMPINFKTGILEILNQIGKIVFEPIKRHLILNKNQAKKVP